MVSQNEFEIQLSNDQRQTDHATNDDDRIKVWLDLPYNGKQGEQLVTSLIKKLKR